MLLYICNISIEFFLPVVMALIQYKGTSQREIIRRHLYIEPVSLYICNKTSVNVVMFWTRIFQVYFQVHYTLKKSTYVYSVAPVSLKRSLASRPSARLPGSVVLTNGSFRALGSLRWQRIDTSKLNTWWKLFTHALNHPRAADGRNWKCLLIYV